MRSKKLTIIGVIMVLLAVIAVSSMAADNSSVGIKKMEEELNRLRAKLKKAKSETTTEVAEAKPAARAEVKAAEIEVATAAEEASGIEVSAGVDLASAYVFRGATFNDGFVVQPGVSIAGLPIEFGVWANIDIDDYDGAANDGQFSEIDIYGSYSLPLPSDFFDVSIGYCEYTYPGWGDPQLDASGAAVDGGGEADREASISIGLDLPLEPSLTINYGLDGGIKEDLYIELGAGHEMEVEKVTVSMSAALGFLDPSEGDSGLSHINISLGASYGIFSLSGTYVGQIDDDVLADVEDGGSYDTEFYATLGISNTF